MKPLRFTHLVRSVDPRLPLHRWVLAVSAGAGAVASATRDGGVASWASAAAAAFLAWALARELDPDRPRTAVLVCLVAGLVGAVAPGSSPGALFLLLLATRIIAGTTGLAPTAWDLAVCLVAAGALATTPSGWISGMALAFGIARDASLPDPAPPRQLAWAAGTALVVSVVAGSVGGIGSWMPPTTLQWFLVAAGLAGSAVIAQPEHPTSRTDHTDAPLDPQRLQWARFTAVAAAALITLVGGGPGVTAVAPLWATLATLGAARLYRWG